ncbi:MAG: L-threonylcarbamoyladenylate synthase [Desulfurococcaceae archaeon]
MVIILRTDPSKPDPLVLKKAAEILKNHGVVAFPTETVYGLGAIVFHEDAVLKVFKAKNRPPDNPLIIHVDSIDMVYEVARDIPDKALRLIKRLWPGPLTLILPRNPKVPKIVTGGLDTVAVRMPGHPVALGLIHETGMPIAAPSANLSGRPSPTSAEHVLRDLGDKIDAIIDAGETLYGVESTVLNVLIEPPVLLRPGAYPIEIIEEILGEKIFIPEYARGLGYAEIAFSPGMKYRHYAPEAKVVLIEPRSDGIDRLVEMVKDISKAFSKAGEQVCIVASSETYERYAHIDSFKVFNIGSRRNLFEVAHNLFKVLRELDENKCSIAIVEGFEERGLGLTIMNRLRKASSIRLEA